MTPKTDIPLEEQETTINYAKYHLGEWAEVYTTDKVVMKRYEKFRREHGGYCRLVSEDKYSMTFSVHPKCVGVYPRAPRRTREMTEEEKEAARVRLAAARNKNA